MSDITQPIPTLTTHQDSDQEVDRPDDLDAKRDSNVSISTPDAENLGAVREEPTVTRWEEWAYYLYYNGDNGVGPLNYAATLFLNHPRGHLLTHPTQSLANAAGHAPDGSACTDDQCYLDWGGSTRSVGSIVLIANGISFAIMTVLFTTIGSAADYGDVNKWVLIVSTVVCWASQFGFVDLWLPSQWKPAMGLFMLGFITYGVTLAFYASVFPRLARNTARTKAAREAMDKGESTVADYEQVEMLERNRLSNISTAHSNWGYLFTLILNIPILLCLKDNPKVDNYALVFTNCYWVVTGLPWFFLQKKRSGPPLPKGEHWLTIGWKQIWQALHQIKKLPYTFAYLGAFFLLADGLNTTGTLVGIIQNQVVQFSFLQNTLFGVAQALTSIISCYAFWYIQKWTKTPTKVMFQVTNVITVIIPFWGMLGLWTNKIGFHNMWEFWFYNVLFGLGQAPYYAYAQTMMADLTPPGYEGMFFGLFGITNRASSLIGPNVVSAIIDRSHNQWHGFIFLFIICFLAALSITLFVKMDTGHAQAVAFSIEKRGMTADVRAEQAAGVVADGVDHQNK